MPLPVLAELGEVLARYGLSRADGTEPRRASTGFSGADVWQVATLLGPLCVRRWPTEHPTPSQLQRIHAVLRQAFAAGCGFVPSPLVAADGSSFVSLSGRLWEVTPWMPGRPLQEDKDLVARLSAIRLSAILTALAAFHRATTAELDNNMRAPSPGLSERLRKLVAGILHDLPRIQSADLPHDWQELARRRDEFVRLFAEGARFVRPQLAATATVPVALLPCIRDIRREHVLFTDDEVTGWVDFGALRDDHPACDLARVLGEFLDDDRGRWDAALEQYADRQQRELPRLPREVWMQPALVQAFDRSGTLLSPLNWLRWIFLEQRDFPDRDAVVRRFDQLLARLRRMVETA